MENIEIEYNRDLKPLEAVLSLVSRPGDFFVSGAMELPMPKVEIEGAGVLSFPVPDAQIAAIVRKADRAPHGRGRKTIVDTSVRKVWQIAPDKVQIGGKSWPSNFQAILSKVSAGLGCGEANVSAELYKLLVYDRGGFFLPHRDTEKTDGMFGTLVVTLPSPHRGGGLRLETFSPVTLIVPAIEQICSGRRQKTAAVDSGVALLWTSAAEFLLRRGEVPPEPPSNWSINVELSCSCPDCQELQSFARDPVERVHRFRVRKERRRHLHSVIDRQRLDMTHVTDRVGSPQTLVCTKDRRTFDRQMKQYQDEIAAMRALVALAPSSGNAAALSERMQKAVKRAVDLKQRGASTRK